MIQKFYYTIPYIHKALLSTNHQAYSFYSIFMETIRVVTETPKETVTGYAIIVIIIIRKNIWRKQGRIEIRSAPRLLTPIQTTRWKFLPRSQSVVVVSFAWIRTHRGYFFSTYFYGDDRRRWCVQVFSLLRGPRGKCKWHTLIAVTGSCVSLSKTSEKNYDERIWLMAFLLARVDRYLK